MKLTARSFAVLLGTALFTGLASAADIRVEPGPDALVRAVALAQAWDRLILTDGTYEGGIVLHRPIEIDGQGNAEVTGTGSGSVITIDAPDVVIDGLRLTGSGSSHETIDSGVQMTRNATRAIVRNNHIEVV